MLQAQSQPMYPPPQMYNMPMGGMSGVPFGLNSYATVPNAMPMMVPTAPTSSVPMTNTTNPAENLLSQLNPNQLQQILSILNPKTTEYK